MFPSPETFRTLGELPVLSTDYKTVEAEELFKKVLASREKTFGYDALPTLDTVNELANISKHQGNYSVAFDLYERVANGRLTKLGKGDPETLEAFNNLAVTWSVLHVLGIRSSENPLHTRFNKQYEYAGKEISLWELFQHLRTNRESYLGNDHPDTLKTAIAYADLLHDVDDKMKLIEAKKLYERVLNVREEANGSSSPSVLAIVEKLANVLYDQKRLMKPMRCTNELWMEEKL